MVIFRKDWSGCHVGVVASRWFFPEFYPKCYRRLPGSSRSEPFPFDGHGLSHEHSSRSQVS